MTDRDLIPVPYRNGRGRVPLRERLAFRVAVAIEAERTFGYVRPKDEREWRFVRAFVRESVTMAMRNGGEVTRRVRREAASAAVREAGYPEKNPKPVANRGTEMLALPRIQAGIMDTFAAAGVDIPKIATMFADILSAELGTKTEVDDDGKAVTTSSGVTASDKLKVADMFFRTTTGFAPTKNANTNVNVPVDAFYDADVFKKTPPIKTVDSK